MIRRAIRIFQMACMAVTILMVGGMLFAIYGHHSGRTGAVPPYKKFFTERLPGAASQAQAARHD